MIEAQQFDFDFQAAEKERPIMEHFARLERLAREEWSEENLCLAWVTESDGRAWRDWWAAQPAYERSRMLSLYRCERERADWVERPMRQYKTLLPSSACLAQDRAIIEYFMKEIKEAALHRRPMPLRESPEMDPLECMTFRRRLSAAMLELGVVIIEANPEDRK